VLSSLSPLKSSVLTSRFPAIRESPFPLFKTFPYLTSSFRHSLAVFFFFFATSRLHCTTCRRRRILFLLQDFFTSYRRMLERVFSRRLVFLLVVRRATSRPLPCKGKRGLEHGRFFTWSPPSFLVHRKEDPEASPPLSYPFFFMGTSSSSRVSPPHVFFVGRLLPHA